MDKPDAKPAARSVTDVAAAKPERAGRLSADDWAQAALDLIAEQGVAAVAVEPLARRLGVTKGSFYWHFPSRDALLQAALERWESVEQEAVFGTLERVPDPRERLRALFRMVAHEYQSHVIYSALIKALDYAEASAVQPFSYTLLVFVAILGAVVFGDIPDGWTMAGAAVIVASGLYTWHHERRRQAR